MHTVVITGAGTGIGRDCALYLAAQGWRVFAGTRDEAERAAWPETANVTPLVLDVTDSASIAAAVDAVGGELHGLVNNAALNVAGPLERLPVDDVRRVFDVNVFGVVATSAAFLPALREGGGRLVHVGSSAAGFATPLMGPYCASKAALEALAEAQRRELKPWGIEVSVVAPGPVDTEVWDRDYLAHLDDSARSQYADAIAAFRKGAESNRGRRIPARAVSLAIEHALTAPTPRLRYDPGVHAKIARLLLHRLPGRLADRLLELLTG